MDTMEKKKQEEKDYLVKWKEKLEEENEALYKKIQNDERERNELRVQEEVLSYALGEIEQNHSSKSVENFKTETDFDILMGMIGKRDVESVQLRNDINEKIYHNQAIIRVITRKIDNF